MTTNDKPFEPQHPWDRNAFALFLLICWAGVLFGFVPASSARIQGHADYPAPWVLHVHAVAFTGWMVMLTAQILLVRTRNLAIHRRLGLIGVALVPIMAASGIASEFFSQRFYVGRDPQNLAFFILPILNIAMFTVLATGALLAARRDPSGHKRLILMATTVIVGVGYARWWGDALTALVGNGFWELLVNTYAAPDLILLLAAGYDLATRRRIHPAYAYGLSFIVAVQVLASWIYHAPWWIPVSRGWVESEFLRVS